MSTKAMVVYKGVEMSKGRYLFNKCLPDDYPVVNEIVDKKKLNSILKDIVFRYSGDIAISVLDNVKKLGFMGSTLNGFTLSLSDLYSDKLYNYGESLTGELNEDMKRLNEPDLIEELNKLPLAEFINSGARGTWEQARQVVLCRGYVSDVSGDIKKNVIRSSLLKGLPQKEFFYSSYGARKALLDTAVSTGDSGFLTRKLIYATATIELGEEEDCGTKDYLNLLVTDEKHAKSLMWRYVYLKDRLFQINLNNYKEFIGKNIKLRSPIYCTSKKICKTCYGNTWRLLHTNQVGIIATQALGEVSVQLVLRSFHTAGVAKVKEGESKQDDIVSGMTAISEIFHKAKDMELENGPSDIVVKLYNIFNEYKPILSIHHEIITSSLMWHGDKHWRLINDRMVTPITWTSILQVPSKQSWLLGFAFSHVNRKLLDAVISEEEDVHCELTKLFKF